MSNSLRKKTTKLTIGMFLGSILLATTGCGGSRQTNPYAVNPYGQQQQFSQGGYSDYGSGGYSDYGSGYNNPSYMDPTYTNTFQSNLPTGSVSGRVVDTLTGMGVPMATISVMGIRPAISIPTDSSGNFTLPNVPQGRQVLVVQKQGYTSLVGNSNIVVNVTPGNTISAPQINIVPDRASVANGFVKAFDGFKHPRGLTVNNNSGEIYIVDVIGIGGMLPFDRAEVKKINSDGGVVDNFGSRIVNSDFRSIDIFRMLKRSTGIGVDSGGNIYIADTGNDVVKRYGPTGRYIGEIDKEFKNVFDVSVTTTGDLIVSDPGNARVSLLDSSMNIRVDNILGSAASDGIRGITTDNADNIYIIDASAAPGEVIKKFDRNGNRLPLQFGIIGGFEDGYFNNPTDLAIDNRNGDIYVVDTGNNRIQRFNAEGHFLSQFGQFGSENGSFNAPWGIAIDNQGFVYVADSKNSRVQKFMPGRFGQNNY